jgi:hypothetical protein
MQVGKQAEEEVQKRITAAGELWTHQAAMQNKLELARTIGDLAAKWKIIPGDDTQLEEVMATAMKELLRQSNELQEQARIGSKGLRGSQEHRWVTTGPKGMGSGSINWGFTFPGESERTSTSPTHKWYREVKCKKRTHRRKPRADENRAVSRGKRNTKRWQVSKNNNTDSAHFVLN